jgi:thiamine-monophosphate kinase
MSDRPDEFEWIARLLRPLTRGAPEALNLEDDAAVLGAQDDFDMVVTADALVEGVHFLSSDPPESVARKLLRVNLSDLAAKACVPFGYLMTVAWPEDSGWDRRQRFVRGLGQDQSAFGLVLLGGDTVSTPGPWTLSVTMMGWGNRGGMVKRSGGRPGDLLVVSGTIGDAWLGLRALAGEVSDPRSFLAGRYRLPQPRLGWRDALIYYGRASADVSDGLLADAGHIAEASGCGLEIDLDQMPMSSDAVAWLALQEDKAAAHVALATGGDDYEIVCAIDPADWPAFQAATRDVAPTVIGRLTHDGEIVARYEGRNVTPERLGWSH